MKKLLASALIAFSAPSMAAVQFATTQFEVSEGDGTITIDVVLTNQDSAVAPVTVNFATIPGTAVSPADYVTTSGTLQWTVGDFTSKQITITITNDMVEEQNESFFVELEDAVGAPLGPNALATILIVDDDGVGPGDIQWSVTDLSVPETAGTLSIPLRRLAGSSGRVSAEVSRVGGGTATPGVDFFDQPQILTWEAGDMAPKNFTGLTIIDDQEVEMEETINYRIINLTGGATSTRDMLMVRIRDNDQPIINTDPGVIGFRNSMSQAFENQGAAEIFVERLDGSFGRASATFRTIPGTAGFADFTPRTGTLVWDDGDDTPKSIVVPIQDNAAVDDPSTRTFTIEIDSATGAEVGAAALHTVNILDDDVDLSSVIGFENSSISVDREAGVALVSLTRTGNLSRRVDVALTTENQSAVAGQDYTALEGRVVSWAAGDGATKVVTITIGGEPSLTDKTFRVRAEESFGDVRIPSDTATVTISGTAPSLIGFAQQMVSVPTNAVTALVQVRRQGSGVGEVSARVSVEPQTAREGIDFISSGSLDLTWGDGDTSPRTVAFEIPAPMGVVASRTFRLNLQDFTGPARADATAGSTTVTLPGQPPSLIGFRGTEMTVFDNDGAAVITLERSGSSTAAVSVLVSTMQGSAISGIDFEAIDDLAVRWEAGDMSPKSVSVRVNRNEEPTQRKSFSMRLERDSGPSVVDQGGSIFQVNIRSRAARDQAGAGSVGGPMIALMLIAAALIRRRAKLVKG